MSRQRLLAILLGLMDPTMSVVREKNGKHIKFQVDKFTWGYSLCKIVGPRKGLVAIRTGIWPLLSVGSYMPVLTPEC